MNLGFTKLIEKSYLSHLKIIFNAVGKEVSLYHRFLLNVIISLRLRQSEDTLRTPSARKARKSIRSGYAFAHQEGFGGLITSGKLMRKTARNFVVEQLGNSHRNVSPGGDRAL